MAAIRAGASIDPQVGQAPQRLGVFFACCRNHVGGHAWAERGILIADTKLEFGLDEAGVLHVMDEMLTPDSSRFWPADSYSVGTSPPSYDKQFVRDYLETLDWDKTAPGPHVPAQVIAATRAKYAEALWRLADLRID